MRAIMLMFDSLNRRFLPPYGCDWVHAPNFQRLAERTVTFDNSYVGSLPCMPARRELHTGRYNFLHRGWGPMEPFDDSVFEMLDKAGVTTHLISDHGHYWEDGGATYHNRYTSWENVRGQEGDRWKADLTCGAEPTTFVPLRNPMMLAFKRKSLQQDAVNRTYMPTPDKSAQAQVYRAGLEFLETNHTADNWFVQIECFDPHEPFFTFEEYLKLYDLPDIGKQWDWPPYDTVHETPEEVQHIRTKYAALVSQCDENLGRVLDVMDKYDMWKDTMLIVNTDHGFLLGEHNWWAKNAMPCYDEIVHTPLFIWDPRCGKAGERRQALVQTIDMGPTLLEFFGQELTPDMRGRPLRDTVDHDEPVREYALFGYHGNQFNITDGRYVYMMEPADPSVRLYEYTLMPTRMRGFMGAELREATLVGPLSFTKGMPVLRVPDKIAPMMATVYPAALYDLRNDPDELTPISDPETEARLRAAAAELLRQNDAPAELFERFGL